MNWNVLELFASPIARVSMLLCRPDTLECSCEKCAVDNQLVFVRRGGFIRHIGKSSHVVNANKATFFRAHEPYRTTHIDRSGDTCLVFSFPDRVIPRHLLDALPGAACAAVAPALVGRAIKVAAYPARHVVEPLEVEEGAMALLEEALPAARRQSDRGAARAVMRDIEAALTAEPGAKWSLTGLSQQFRRNPYYIARSFRAATGVSLHRYLLNLRLANALPRLMDGEDNLAVLAFELGFSSHAHFSAAFRSAVGTSPSRFRERTRKPRGAEKTRNRSRT